MDYQIRIDKFEGPMDLLLHLIKKSDIDIVEINIEEITKQYLDYINQMKKLNLDIASEYLTLSAELIEIKSATLLPNNCVMEDDYEEDPRQNLINRLLEYKKYKEMIDDFKDLENKRNLLYTKLPSNLKEYSNYDKKQNYGDVSLDDLMNALSNFLERKKEEKPLSTKITKKEYSVTQRSREIKSILNKKKKIEFEELFEVVTKQYVVVTFLSILEMAKKGELIITQDNNFSKILLSLKEVK